MKRFLTLGLIACAMWAQTKPLDKRMGDGATLDAPCEGSGCEPKPATKAGPPTIPAELEIRYLRASNKLKDAQAAIEKLPQVEAAKVLAQEVNAAAQDLIKKCGDGYLPTEQNDKDGKPLPMICAVKPKEAEKKP